MKQSNVKAIILCAGYGTRLGHYTENTPKALLKINGETLLDLLVENLAQIDEVDDIVIVSNDKFARQFEHEYDRLTSAYPAKNFIILNDGSTSNETRLGAIGDIRFARDSISKMEHKPVKEMIVTACDNYFDFSLKDFYDFYKSHKTDMAVFVQEMDMIKDYDRLCAGGVASLDSNNKILDMEEKPKVPFSKFAVGPFYVFSEKATKMIDTYLDNGGKKDAPGNYPAWLSTFCPVHAFNITERGNTSIDIGDIKTYESLTNKDLEY